MLPLLFALNVATVEAGDLIVPGLASSGGAIAGAFVGAGVAAGGLALTVDPNRDPTAPVAAEFVALNSVTSFFVVAGPAVLAVVGAGAGGAVSQGFVTALGAGFGAVVGSGVGTLLGFVVARPGGINVDAATAVAGQFARGAFVAVAAGLGAGVGGACALAAFHPEELE